METMYEKMKAKGIDMSWYEKNKHRIDSGIVPLEDEECSPLSIYNLALDGSLWTIDAHGKPYKKVREGIKKQTKSVYICACCKKQWANVLDKEDKTIHPDLENTSENTTDML